MVPESRRTGSRSKHIRNVEITFTVMVLSVPSASRYVGVAIPALRIAASNLSSFAARPQNSFTLA